MEDYILPFQWTSDEFSSGVARNTLSRLRNGGADLAGWAAAECGQEYAEGADATGRAADSGEHELPLHPPAAGLTVWGIVLFVAGGAMSGWMSASAVRESFLDATSMFYSSDADVYTGFAVLFAMVSIA